MFDKKKWYYENREKLREQKKQWAINNKEKVIESKKKSYIKHRDKRSKYHKNLRSERRSKFFELYGNVCECCGESELEFLVLHHKKGSNRKDNSHNSTVYYKLAIEKYDPEEYGTLCCNCNVAMRWGRICPHKLNSMTEEE